MNVNASADGATISTSSASAIIPLQAKLYVWPINVGIGSTYSSLAVAVSGISNSFPACATVKVTEAAAVRISGYEFIPPDVLIEPVMWLVSAILTKPSINSPNWVSVGSSPALK